MKNLVYPLILFIFFLPQFLLAQINDNNGDGKVVILAFGDSITYGIGSNGIGDDRFQCIYGYPEYLSEMLDVVVDNQGVPGEELTQGGSQRFFSLVKKGIYDLALIMEGVNDSVHQVSPFYISLELQKIINVAIAHRVEPVLFTLPQPMSQFKHPWVAAYNQEITKLAYINKLRYVDLELIWSEHGCDDTVCEYYNMPEGLHPNAEGYQLIAESVYEVLMGEKKNAK